jgi:hypothetical protein
MKNRLHAGRVYSGDNGRLFCADHAGATAKASGRDLSGQRVFALTTEEMAYLRRETGEGVLCETCRTRPRGEDHGRRDPKVYVRNMPRLLRTSDDHGW